MVYKTTMSKTVKIITILVGLIFILQIGINIYYSNKIGWLISIILILIYFYSYSIKPICYELTKNEIIVRRLISNKIIPRHAIEKVEILDADNMKGVYRIFGSGGLWGNIGIFGSRGLGTFQAYTTGFHNLILVRMKKNKKIVISPDDVFEFVNEYSHS